MARHEFRLPDIGEGVTEGELVAWGEGIAVGASVRPDQTLAEVMTDKATVTIPSPKAGRVLELAAKVGDVIAVGAVLIVLETAAEEPASLGESARRPHQAHAPDRVSPPVPPPTASEPSSTAAGTIPEVLPGVQTTQDVHEISTPASAPGSRPLAAPATRQRARELGVDLSSVQGSGPAGRITRDDVERHAREGTAGADLARAHSPAPLAIPPRDSSSQGTADERVPLRGVRKKIFEQMTRSKHTAAHFTFVEECDVTALLALRSRLRPLAEERGVKLTFLPFIVKACVAALQRHPMLNAAFDETTQEIVLRRSYNIGIATATPAGLLVPVVKAADKKSLLEIAREIERLADQALSGKIQLADLQGSTFTITSLGARGGLFATPILNFPESAILGVHQIKKKPVVRDDSIQVGHVMLLSLSFDHRLIDGHVGAAFAYDVIGYLESPDGLLLEMA